MLLERHKGMPALRKPVDLLIRFKHLLGDLKLQHPLPQHKINLIHNSLPLPAQRNPHLPQGHLNNKFEIDRTLLAELE